MNCSLRESPGFRVCRIKSPLFQANRIFRWSESLLVPKVQTRNTSPDIRTGQIETYIPFHERQPERHLKLSEIPSGKYERKSDLITYSAENTRIGGVLHNLSRKSSQLLSVDEQLSRQ